MGHSSGSTTTNDFKYFAFLNAYLESDFDAGTRKIKYEIILKNIAEGTYQIMLSGSVDESEDYLAKAPICFTSDNQHLIYSNVTGLFEGMDWNSYGGGRISLENGALEEIVATKEMYEYQGYNSIRSPIDDDTFITMEMMPPIMPLTGFGTYSFSTRTFTSLISSEDKEKFTHGNTVVIQNYNSFALVKADSEIRLYDMLQNDYRLVARWEGDIYRQDIDLYSNGTAVSRNGVNVSYFTVNENSEFILTLLTIDNE